MSVTRENGAIRISPHAIEVIASPVAARLVLLCAILLAAVLLRRLHVSAPFGRMWRLAVLFLFAGYLVLCRVWPPRSDGRTLEAVPTPSLLPGDLPAELQDLSPIDRITMPGFEALVDAVRTRVPEHSPVVIVPASESDAERQQDAWRAAWMIWPRRASIAQPGGEPPIRRGFHVILGDNGGVRTETDEAIFRNRAGSIRSYPEGQPR
jgi:hypothetical protein